MARIKQSQNIDRLIQGIESLVENRCSLSEADVMSLNEALMLLRCLKLKKGKTNKEVLQVIAEVVELISNFFKS